MVFLSPIIAISLTPYQGLKPAPCLSLGVSSSYCNFTYSLLGIETASINSSAKGTDEIAISLTPYQGLKRLKSSFRQSLIIIAISLTPYQGLKHGEISMDYPGLQIAISLTPYQGLKRQLEYHDDILFIYCNFTYSLLGIETLCLIESLFNANNCNFTYSLLGIETPASSLGQRPTTGLQFHLLPIRD